ncbi:hypothetical protein AAMO2058_000399800 [Amorphochlora amoebiformis]
MSAARGLRRSLQGTGRLYAGFRISQGPVYCQRLFTSASAQKKNVKKKFRRARRTSGPIRKPSPSHNKGPVARVVSVGIPKKQLMRVVDHHTALLKMLDDEKQRMSEDDHEEPYTEEEKRSIKEHLRGIKDVIGFLPFDLKNKIKPFKNANETQDNQFWKLNGRLLSSIRHLRQSEKLNIDEHKSLTSLVYHPDCIEYFLENLLADLQFSTFRKAKSIREHFSKIGRDALKEPLLSELTIPYFEKQSRQASYEMLHIANQFASASHLEGNPKLKKILEDIISHRSLNKSGSQGLQISEPILSFYSNEDPQFVHRLCENVLEMQAPQVVTELLKKVDLGDPTYAPLLVEALALKDQPLRALELLMESKTELSWRGSLVLAHGLKIHHDGIKAYYHMLARSKLSPPSEHVLGIIMLANSNRLETAWSIYEEARRYLPVDSNRSFLDNILVRIAAIHGDWRTLNILSGLQVESNFVSDYLVRGYFAARRFNLAYGYLLNEEAPLEHTIQYALQEAVKMENVKLMQDLAEIYNQRISCNVSGVRFFFYVCACVWMFGRLCVWVF